MPPRENDRPEAGLRAKRVILPVYAVYDSKAKLFLHPFFCLNRAVAARIFSDVANDKGTNVGQHPLDFSLFEIAEFDSLTGIITARTHMENLGVAALFIEENRHGKNAS